MYIHCLHSLVSVNPCDLILGKFANGELSDGVRFDRSRKHKGLDIDIILKKKTSQETRLSEAVVYQK